MTAMLLAAFSVRPAAAGLYEVYRAVEQGDIARIDALFAAGEDPSLSGFSGSVAETPILQAAARGDLAMVRRLMHHGMDVEFRDRHGDRGLQLAVKRDMSALLGLLLEAGSKPDIAGDPRSETPLLLSIRKGRHHLSRMLLEHGAGIGGDIYPDETPLHAAAQWGKYSTLVSELLALGADAAARRADDGQTPLHAAAAQDHAETLRELVKAGAPPDARDMRARTALFVASERGRAANVDFLLSAGGDGNARDGDGVSPLLAAIENHSAGAGGHEDAARLLIPLSDDRDRALATALWAGLGELATELLDAGAGVNGLDRKGRSTLAGAVHAGGVVLFDRVVGAGADIGRYGPEALVESARVGNYYVVLFLLAQGVSPDSGGVHGSRPIVVAATEGHPRVVEMLIGYGAKFQRVEILHVMNAEAGRVIAEIARREASRASEPADALYERLELLEAAYADIRRLVAVSR